MNDYNRLTVMLTYAGIAYSEVPGADGTSALRLEHDNDTATWFFFDADGLLDNIDTVDMDHVGNDKYTIQGGEG
jgi:hypothetical protein